MDLLGILELNFSLQVWKGGLAQLDKAMSATSLPAQVSSSNLPPQVSPQDPRSLSHSWAPVRMVNLNPSMPDASGQLVSPPPELLTSSTRSF
jgi:hypothetical protein